MINLYQKEDKAERCYKKIEFLGTRISAFEISFVLDDEINKTKLEQDQTTGLETIRRKLAE